MNDINSKKKIKIIIVEDERVTALNLEKILKNAGYFVEKPCVSGEEALECIENESADLIIMDINLAGKIDGIETAKIIKEDYHIPIIYITAYSDEKILNRAKKTEPHGFIIKPFNRNNILSTIEVVLYKYKYDKKLEISEKKFHDLFENMIEGFVHCGILFDDNNKPADFIFHDTNFAFDNLINKNHDDIIGEKLSRVFQDDDSELIEILKKVAADKEGLFFRFKSNLINKWLSIKAYLPQEGYIAILFNDITERIDLELERKRVLAELDQIFNTTVIGICLIDREYNLIRLNNTFLKLFNLKKSDAIGEKCYNILNEPECKTELCPMKNMLEGISKVEYEINKELDDNTNLKCLVTVSPFFSHEGEIQGILKTYTDITEVRRLEKEIMNISEMERQNIGQDLHDSLGQKLTGVAFLCEALKQEMADKGYPELGDIQEIIEIVGDSIDQTRKIAKGLCPVNIDTFGIDTALEELILETERLFNIPCKIEKSELVDIKDNSVARNLYYIAKESVNNSIKHGNAEWINLKLHDSDKELVMSVENNITPGSNPGYGDIGMGLRIMRYRADIIGAEFDYENKNNTFIVNVKLKKKTKTKI